MEGREQPWAGLPHGGTRFHDASPHLAPRYAAPPPGCFQVCREETAGLPQKIPARCYVIKGKQLNTVYRHTRTGHAILAGMASLVAVAFVLDHGILALAALAPIAIIFSSLTIRIDNGELLWSFGPGWLVRKKVPLARIEDARVVRNRWIDGWGIHYTGRDGGWLCNVPGFHAAQVWLKNGGHLRCGSDQPEALAVTIRAALQP